MPPHLGAITEDETSGTTGRPLRFLINELVEVAALAATDRLYRWWQFDGSKPMVSFVSPRLELANPEQTVTHGWHSGFLDGLNIMRKASGDIDDHIDWLRNISPKYLSSQARMLRPLAERKQERGVKLHFDGIISRESTVDDEVWPLCRKVFKARLIDQYGANEIGQIACQCPHCEAYHINAEIVLVEVLDQEGAPVAPGETGRVVLTAFYNYAMPFIRYEIGDNAQIAPTKSDCAITLPRLTRIMGRYRNNFKLRDGRVIFPHPPMSGF